MLPLFAGLAAFPLIFLVLQDAFEVMLLPRRVRRRLRLVRWFFQATWAVGSGVARQLPAGERRERLLSQWAVVASGACHRSKYQ